MRISLSDCVRKEKCSFERRMTSCICEGRESDDVSIRGKDHTLSAQEVAVFDEDSVVSSAVQAHLCGGDKLTFTEWASAAFSLSTSFQAEQSIVNLRDRMFETERSTPFNSDVDRERENLIPAKSSGILADRDSRGEKRFSSTSTQLETMVAATKDDVWRSLTRNSFFSRNPPCWDVMRTRLLHIGSLRLSLTKGRPSEHGLEMPDCGSEAANLEAGVFRSEDELAAFQRKMADMKAVLEDELEELRQQELGLYVKRVEEDMQAMEVFNRMQAILQQEVKELAHQDHVLELDIRERVEFPDPVILRPDLNSAQDEDTRRIQEEGLQFVGSDNTQHSLRYEDLPPELDLSELLSQLPSKS